MQWLHVTDVFFFFFFFFKKPPKLYDFKTFKNLLFVHKNWKTYSEDMLDKSASIFPIFLTADKELKQPSRAIIREKPTLCMQKKTIRKSSKPVFYYNKSSATHRLILSVDTETNPGQVYPDNQQTKPKSDRLSSSICKLCNKTIQINSKRLMCIYCRSLVHLKCNSLKAILNIKISRKAYE